MGPGVMTSASHATASTAVSLSSLHRTAPDKGAPASTCAKFSKSHPNGHNLLPVLVVFRSERLCVALTL